MNRVTTLFIFLLTMVMCMSSSANDDKNFPEKIRASGIVDESESILLSSNVYFYPNKKGHGLFSGGGKKRSKGYIVFTENGFAVVSWSRRNKQYEPIHQEKYIDLATVDVAGNSPMLRLVTETKSTGKYNSYEIMDGRNALTPNVGKTEEAHKLVSVGISGEDVRAAAAASDLSTVEINLQKQRMQELEERIAKLEKAEEPAPEALSSTECDCKCPQN